VDLPDSDLDENEKQDLQKKKRSNGPEDVFLAR
jgi:hypothetical protein